MLKLIIEDDEGRKTVVPFVREEITIGRQEGNTIRLTERNVSRRHARLLRQNGAVQVEDLGSYNGIRINGEKIQGRAQIHDGDLIQIGDYDLAIQHEGQAQPHPPPLPEGGAEAPPPPPLPTNGVHGNGATPPGAAATPAAAEEIPPPPPPAARKDQATSIIRVDQVEANRPREVVEIDAAEAPRLVCITSEFAGREFACIRSELRVGRTDDNDIAIDHRSLSRTHAKIVRETNGEWRVLDMQSANGLSVNGEIYAQATLRPGDTLELGHVKFKFLGPGQEYKPSADRVSGGGRASKLPMMVVAGAVVAGGAATGAYLFFRPPPQPPQVPQIAKVVVQTPVQPPEPPVAPAPPRVDPQLETKLQKAKDAITALDFARAVGLLESLQSERGLPPDKLKEVGALLEHARTELAFKAKLDEASEAIAAGKLPDAEDLLGASAGTTAYERDRKDLLAKLESAKAAVRPKPVAPLPPPRPPAKTVDAKGLFEDAKTLFHKLRYREALTQLNKCIEVDPAFAACEMLLGSTYAKLEDPERGAKHYRRFVELAPDDPNAARVRQLLEAYEQPKKK